MISFRCSKYETVQCPFRLRAKILHTDDPKNERFWEVENWAIADTNGKNHTCLNLLPLQLESDNKIVQQKNVNQKKTSKASTAPNFENEFQMHISELNETQVSQLLD